MKNVTHFCFTCGRIGHAAMNCEGAKEDSSVKYGEELRASPPRRSRNIIIMEAAPRAARPLFQTSSQRPASSGASYGRRSDSNKAKDNPGAHEQDGPAERASQDMKQKLGHENHEDQHTTHDQKTIAEDEQGMAHGQVRSQNRKEHVSFGTNMTAGEESSDGTSAIQTELELAMTVEHFHARKIWQ
jgi:hypothetical protein